MELLKKVVRDKIYLSFIFFGELGIGKILVVVVLVNDLGLKYDYFNVLVNLKVELIKMFVDNDVLIIDEIYRLNKDK